MGKDVGCPQALPKFRRAEIDPVGELLLAEADLQRDDLDRMFVGDDAIEVRGAVGDDSNRHGVPAPIVPDRRS